MAETVTQLKAKMRHLLADTPTTTLITSLLAVDAMPRSPERNLVRGMTIEQLEQRYPQAAEAVARAFDEAEARIQAGEPTEVDYVAVLVAAIQKIR